MNISHFLKCQRLQETGEIEVPVYINFEFYTMSTASNEFFQLGDYCSLQSLVLAILKESKLKINAYTKIHGLLKWPLSPNDLIKGDTNYPLISMPTVWHPTIKYVYSDYFFKYFLSKRLALENEVYRLLPLINPFKGNHAGMDFFNHVEFTEQRLLKFLTEFGFKETMTEYQYQSFLIKILNQKADAKQQRPIGLHF